MTSKIKTQSIQLVKPEWKTIGVKVRLSELPNLNRQLDRLSYTTLGNLEEPENSDRYPKICKPWLFED